MEDDPAPVEYGLMRQGFAATVALMFKRAVWVGSLAAALTACGGTAMPDATTGDVTPIDATASDVGMSDVQAHDVPAAMDLAASETGCPDHDGDGHTSAACGGDDCDDNDANRFPGNSEVCRIEMPDGGVITRTDLAHGFDPTHDEDCDPSTFANAMTHDGDHDGDGAIDSACSNTDRSGMVYRGLDCDDLNPVAGMPATFMTLVAPGSINRSTSEVCNGVDDNCNGAIDDGLPQFAYHPDCDGDGHGDASATGGTGCSPQALPLCNGHAPVTTHDDCNDTMATVAVCVAPAACQGGYCNPFPSTGAEGAYAPTASAVLPSGEHDFTTITIPVGVTITTNGTGVLDLRATGAVMIAGTIDVSGGDGGSASGGVLGTDFGGSGGNTGSRVTAALGMGGGGGIAGPGSDGISSVGSGGAYGGGAGGAGRLGFGTGGGGGGGGPAGGGGGSVGRSTGGAGGALRGNSPAPASGGGQGGGAPYDGLSGVSGAGGGGSVGLAAASDLVVATTFYPGSGGGGAALATPANGDGGGGGGGALRLTSPASITVPGSLLARGGSGGREGGGGSGGVVYVSAPTTSITGMVNASGGSSYEAAGGLGRIRISTGTAACSLTGSFTPPLTAGCTPSSPMGTAGNAYVGVYPN